MADIGVKMGVTGLSQFKQGMNQARESVKTLNAELKLNEKQYQATGNAETYMANKSKLLEQQIKAQKTLIKDAEEALKSMERNGVEPASASYQKMQQQLLNAKTALLGMEGDLSGVGASAQKAASGANELTTNLKQIGKQVSYQGVIDGIGKITSGIEGAAKRVSNFATSLWETMRDAASWADDKQTLATMYGLDVETLQRMEKTAKLIDTPVEAIVKGQQKLKTNLVYGGKDFDEAIRKLKVGIREGGNWIQNNYSSLKLRDATDIFWDLGEALMRSGDEIDREAMALKIFGRSWTDLKPLFEAGREEYEKTMGEQSVLAEENVKKLGDLDDSLQKLESEFQTLKLTVLSELAPAFTALADALTKIITEVNTYLQTDEGKEKLQALGDAVEQLFKDLTNIDTSAIVEKVSDALDSIKGVLDWIKENKDTIVSAIKAIGIAWAGMKVASVATNVARTGSSLMNLFRGNKGGATPTTGTDTTGGGVPVETGGQPTYTAPRTTTPVNASKNAARGISPSQQPSTQPSTQARTPTQTQTPTNTQTPPRTKPQGPTQNAANNAAKGGSGLGASSAWASLKAGVANVGWTAGVPLAVMAAGIVPAALAQGNINAGLEKDYTEAAEKLDKAAETLGDTAKKDLYFAEAALGAGLVQTDGKGGFKRNMFGELALTPTDQADRLLQVLGVERNRGDLHTLIRNYGGPGGVLGWDPWLMLLRYWGEYRDNSETDYEKRVDMPLDQQEVTALVEYLRDAYTRRLEKQMQDLEKDEGTKSVDEATKEIGESAEKAAQSFDKLAERVDAIKIKVPESLASHANGLPYVPIDGYLALLHKGERVVPANQNRSYNVYNNTYFDRTTVSGGIDADGLAARIAAAQQRALASVGS